MALMLPFDVFQIAYEPSSHTLVGGWPHPLPTEQLPACYEQLLAAAQAQGNCRYWLLDIRRRNWYSGKFGHWFSTEFVPRAAASLGRPLFIAFVVADEQRQFIESSTTDALLRQVAQFDCYPFYFGNEEAGLAWLRDQQAAERASAGSPSPAAVAAR